MIDIRESASKQAMDALNAEFGRNRAVFFRCDVTNNSEFDGNLLSDHYRRNVSNKMKRTLGSLDAVREMEDAICLKDHSLLKEISYILYELSIWRCLCL